LQKVISKQDILEMPKRYRTQLINSITGFKSAALIGTQSEKGNLNLAIFSQIFHLGANPALIGMIVRPAVVPRHTWTNIQETGFFTINHIHPSFVEKAHQCSAKYNEDVSEFEAVGLTPHFEENIKAPFVKESHLKIGLACRDHKLIELNDTILVIGEIIYVSLNDELIKEDGFVDLNLAETVTVSGMDAYFTTQKLGRFNYAKPDEELDKLAENLF
jgi:flavin reductase (DIM6/NTAB) family NADH-FMN oxidoreductase RutF